MSQQKTTIGSPKSPKSSDENSKSDSASSSPSKSGRSPSSTKSSPGGNKSPSLAERLAQSNKAKLNQSLRSPVSKSPPTSPTAALASPKTEVTKECNDIKSEGTDKSKVSNGSVDVKMENTKLPNEQHSAIVENGISDSNEEVKQDVSVESNEKEVKDTDDINKVKEMEQCNLNDGTLALDVGLENKPVRIDDSVILEQTSKKDIRQKVWEFMEENSLVIFPKPCFNRIPNFKGCNNVSLLLEKLEEFKKAKTVQVTPDKAQETARFLTLNWGKRLLVPLLRLKEGLLQNVSLPFAEPSAKMLRSASTQKGLRKWGNKLITLDQNNDVHIDMIILGSVAVDKKGRRIGIGNGFCDLEFVILSSMNMVTDNTVVVTIVHDVQVFDTLPTDIFKPYDVPVDIIITSNEIIRVENRLDRPKDVFWNYISKRRLLEMPPLQLLRTKQEQNDEFDCTLKDVDSEPEEIPPSPRTYKKPKGYRQKRYSTRSETNDSVFKENVVSKHRSSSKHSLAPASKNSDFKIKHKRAKSTSSQHQRSSSTEKRSKQNDKKELRSSSKKPNKRRTKSESAKTVASPVTVTESKSSNGTQADSPSIGTPKNKRRPRPKQSRKRIDSDDIDKQSVNQSNSNGKYNSRSNSRATRRDYIDREDRGREISVGHKFQRDYLPSPKKYFSQNYRQNSYSQERTSYHGSIRSNSRTYHHDSNRPAVVQQNRYSNGPTVRPTRYFNGPMVRHDNFNGPDSRQNGGINHHGIRHNSYSNDPSSRQNSFYDGVISRRNSYSKGSATRQDNYTSSRVFRPPQYRNGMASQTDERDYIQEPRPHFNNNNNNHIGYYNSNEKPNYSRSSSGDEFVLKVGNIANNVRVRDLKAALMERGVKPLHITWRGPRGFAYLRYSNSSDLDKDDVMGSLQNVRIKPNGIETAQTQTLIVTECQFS
ncbi:uncharacterized protein LOC100160598 isoform X2 [Acyrthosiphon pisum]|nr:uncharacterized protein LOC100160598 isoform X2 [Acyrthosiphon pisum]XP_016661777.1 uncharacterized protein LOC100160598 isoform X2 [Acyrthosiphon pisum]|eukprot:XP_003246078.1 PREDICTED: uncharacterized protein LOC100160598 isoform X2 [Acyrthosiphon pisum]